MTGANVTGAYLVGAAGSTADSQLNLVVVALFVLAGVIFITTVVYWRLTRPDRQMVEGRAGVSEASAVVEAD